MKKGITPVIAIVLLLLITIALVGFAYVWFNRVAVEISENVGNQSAEQTRQMGQLVRIESCSGTTATIRNRGTETFNIDTDLVFLVNNVVDSSPGCSVSGDLAPGAVATCTGLGDLSGKTLQVSAPGNSDSMTCS
ncbi:MAG: hypothetical protein B6U68_03020 [Candidatus Aenigmarchaeota archaeon ex4484_14]|nr:MAG: hypothetical protein B6U68_03020 [Candidatus Aenigmarchaeota archaeon ex4484_14]